MLGSGSSIGRLWRELRLQSEKELYRRILRQIYREWHAYGLRRDLREPFYSPLARIPIQVRMLAEHDIPRLFCAQNRSMTRKERLEQVRRIALLAERVATPYVAVDRTCDRPCFLQWIFTFSSNDFVRRYFCGRFPLLARDEALLEYAFTPPAYRGNGIMPAAMSMIAEQAAEYGVRYVVTYVLRNNAAALQGCAKAGFSPYALRHDRSFLLGVMRRRKFTPIQSALADDSVESERLMLVEE